LKITFLGTGTSQGVPIIACKCAVCSSGDVRDKRLRSSVLISHKGHQFVIDTGPDFRQQMLSNNINHLDFVLLTHGHKDHVAGLDDIRAFNHIQGKHIDIYADKLTCESVTREFYYVFTNDKYPGIPMFKLHTIDEQAFTVNNITIEPIKVLHYQLPIFGFRVDNMAYITDANHIEAKELDKMKGLDILIINALGIKKHYSHFNLEEAITIAKYLKPKKTYFTHISHHISHEQCSKTLPKNIELAYDKLTIEL